MADVLRLKNWTTYMSDGRSSASFSTAKKTEVAVCVMVGYEPAKIADDGEWLNVDDVILKMADHIKEARRQEAAKS